MTSVESLQVSARLSLEPGKHFRTVKGSGPTFNRNPVGLYSQFLCVRLWRRRSRVYCEAIDMRSGCTHDLYVDGPSFTSSTGTRERPYRIKLMTDGQVAKATGKRKGVKRK